MENYTENTAAPGHISINDTKNGFRGPVLSFTSPPLSGMMLL